MDSEGDMDDVDKADAFRLPNVASGRVGAVKTCSW